MASVKIKIPGARSTGNKRNSQISVTKIQLIAVSGMADAIAYLYAKAGIGLGQEILAAARSAAAEEAPEAYRQMAAAIVQYLHPTLKEIAAPEDSVVINIGFRESDDCISLNVRCRDGARFFRIEETGHIEEELQDEKSR